MLLRYAFLFALFLIPHMVSADLDITEIMYDQEGSDAGREWVEIYNSGNDLDIVDWHFFENEVHHGFIFEGDTVIGSGERWIIVQDRELMNDMFNNSVSLVKSSFSLNNSGEMLGLSNPNKEVISKVTYRSDDGALGDGNSLQWNDTTWIPAKPTPGTVNATSTQVSVSTVETKTNSGNQKNLDKKNTIKENYYTGYIDVKNKAVAKSPVTIEAFVEHTHDGKITKKLKGGVYMLNFGDGSVVESDRRIEAKHIYDKAGDYQISFEFYPSRLSEEHEDPTIFLTKKLTIYENTIEIIERDASSLISLHNKSSIDVDISGWNISNGSEQFMFPKHSFVLAGGTTHIPFRTHALVNKNNLLLLRNEQNNTIHTYTPHQKNKQEKVLSNNETFKIKTSVTEESINIPLQKISPIDTFLGEYPDKEYADFSATDTLSPPPQEGENNPSFTFVIVAGVVAVLLGILKFMYVSRKITKDDQIDLGEIELIQ